VYLINNITNTANINNATINSINGGSAWLRGFYESN
jgi:hypothetical protein